MTQHLTPDLTPDLIAEALAKYEWIWASEGDDTFIVDKALGDGKMRVTLYRPDEHKGRDVEVEARTFRIVEVES